MPAFCAIQIAMCTANCFRPTIVHIDALQHATGMGQANLQPTRSLLDEGCQSMQVGAWSSLKKPSGLYPLADATLKRKMVLSSDAVASKLQSGETDKAVTHPAVNQLGSECMLVSYMMQK